MSSQVRFLINCISDVAHDIVYKNDYSTAKVLITELLGTLKLVPYALRAVTSKYRAVAAGRIRTVEYRGLRGYGPRNKYVRCHLREVKWIQS